MNAPHLNSKEPPPSHIKYRLTLDKHCGILKHASYFISAPFFPLITLFLSSQLLSFPNLFSTAASPLSLFSCCQSVILSAPSTGPFFVAGGGRIMDPSIGWVSGPLAGIGTVLKINRPCF